MSEGKPETEPASDSPKLSHLQADGTARMVDVSAKAVTSRRAVAHATVHMRADTLAAITAGSLTKGDVASTARLAGIMAAKRTAELIPLCHPLALETVTVEVCPRPPDRLTVIATVAATARTGVEMEALTAAAVGALTIYDMAKSLDPAMTIADIALDEKSGGRRGLYRRGDPDTPVPPASSSPGSAQAHPTDPLDHGEPRP